jgi:hypothetical protein
MNKDKVIDAVRRGYVVDELGTAYNKYGDSVSFLLGNYLNITLNYIVGGTRKQLRVAVHRLQAYQKYGDKLFEKGILVRHKDGNPLNNSWDNILIGTQSENQMDIPKQIRVKRAKNASSHLKKYKNEEIKEFHKESKSYSETMKKFNISSKGTLWHILNK